MAPGGMDAYYLSTKRKLNYYKLHNYEASSPGPIAALIWAWKACINGLQELQNECKVVLFVSGALALRVQSLQRFQQAG